MNTVECVSAPSTTVTSGAPNSPRASTSQPTRASTALRAAASPMAFAIVAPVVTPKPASRGRSSRSSSQRPAASSAAAAAGVASARQAFCPQAAASQSAATPTGCDAPQTQPKNRGAGNPISPGLAAATSSATIASGSPGPAGVGPPKAASAAA